MGATPPSLHFRLPTVSSIFLLPSHYSHVSNVQNVPLLSKEKRVREKKKAHACQGKVSRGSVCKRKMKARQKVRQVTGANAIHHVAACSNGRHRHSSMKLVDIGYSRDAEREREER